MIKEYVKTYSIYGLEKAIREIKSSIETKERQRDEFDKDWSKEYIECYRQGVNEEIAMIETDLYELEEALVIKQTSKRKGQMIAALQKLAEASSEIANLWQSIDDSGITEFDKVLGQEYPFNDSFFETHHNIINWTNNGIRKLGES